ncbi:unnamed protein product [Acanthoscelides obtectus]|uniref:Uncharacterized protein n=1 Tax=Acanthoscelides obtectus TaxID=200917 RepID=A0A9P0KX73_ACAOB|nr:unnamed protein product [Acanthoscelides obtectus]CAK1657718.1 Transmembrane protein 199 [Acanthoscelides obtectus]
MTENISQIPNPLIMIYPSPKLKQYLRMCQGIFRIRGDKSDSKGDIPYLLDEDPEIIEKLKCNSKNNFRDLTMKYTDLNDLKCLSLQDICDLYKFILNENNTKDRKVYLHELLEGSHIILPQNKIVPRNKELQKRCEELRNKENNRKYQEMTKNVENAKRLYHDDKIKWQMEQMDKKLITIFQFIVSLVAGFLFGFTGIELITGSLDLGFRLILGIICASTVALAELYFLAKKLNDDI